MTKHSEENKSEYKPDEELPKSGESGLDICSSTPPPDSRPEKEPSSSPQSSNDSSKAEFFPTETFHADRSEKITEDLRDKGNNDEKDSERKQLMSEYQKPQRIFQRPPEVDDVESHHEMAHEYEEWETAIEPPDGGWGWVIVFASFMIHVIADGFTYTLGIFYVYLLNYYGVTKAAAAWIVSILVGVTLGSGPISGTLVNKFGCRAVTIAGAILASFMLFVSIFANTITTLYFTVGIGAGLGFGLIYLPAIVSVSGYFEKRRSFATGIAVCGSGLGTFIFAPLVEYLIENYNWKGALVIISGLVLNCCFFGALFRPLEVKRIRKTKMSAHMSNEVQPVTPEPQYTMELPTIQFMEDVSKALAKEHIKRKIFFKDQVTDDTDVHVSLSNAELHRDNVKQNGFDNKPVNKRIRTLTTPSSPSGAGSANNSDDIIRINSHGLLNPSLNRVMQSDHLRAVASQPLFSRMDSSDNGPTNSLKATLHPKPLSRKDIFYSNSLLNIPEYKHNPHIYRESLVRHGSLLSAVTNEKPTKLLGCIPCSKDTLDAIHSLTDWGLLKNPIFLLFALSNFLTSIGFNAPYIFIVDRALDTGLDSSKATTLLSVVGIANTISRVLLGYVSDRPWVNRLYLYNVALTICGLGTCASIWMTSYGAQVFYATLFGSMSGAYVGLTSVVLVDLLGMERLTNAFGLILMFQGIASVVGPPLCGSLYDMSNNYNYTFLLAGSMIALSGIILFAIPPLIKYLNERQEKSKN